MIGRRWLKSHSMLFDACMITTGRRMARGILPSGVPKGSNSQPKKSGQRLSLNLIGCVYVCICHGITDHAIERATENGQFDSFDSLRARLGLGNTCGKCVDCAKDIFEEVKEQSSRKHPLHAHA